jgi:DNA-binding MarR family transcriptional regulator
MSQQKMNARIARFVQFNSRMREATLESEQAFLKAVGSISASQLQMLLSVGDHQPCTMSQLAAILHFSKANVSQMVDRLIRDKYVQKIRRQDDQRVVEVSLLAKGQAIVKLNREHVERVAKNWFARLSESEQDTMLDILDRYFMEVPNE